MIIKQYGSSLFDLRFTFFELKLTSTIFRNSVIRFKSELLNRRIN